MSSTITKFFASFLAYGVANKKKRFSAIGRFLGFINKKGEVVIPLEYDNGRSFSEGLAAVCIESQSSKWGYINKDNEEVLPFKYDIAEPFYNNIARVGLYGKSMKINKQGSECL